MVNGVLPVKKNHFVIKVECGSRRILHYCPFYEYLFPCFYTYHSHQFHFLLHFRRYCSCSATDLDSSDDDEDGWKTGRVMRCLLEEIIIAGSTKFH